MLECSNLEKYYGRKRVLKGVSITLQPGEVVGLLGPNGAGKTTVFRIVLGLTPPNRGGVLFEGKDITVFPVHLRARLGLTYLPQEPSVFRRLSVEDNLKLVAEFYLDDAERKSRINELLEEFDLVDVRHQLADELSGGEKRRLELARMLILKPKITLLDEPFSGIDPLTVKEIKKLIKDLKRRNIGVMVTDHNVREIAEVVDRLYVIHKGDIIAEGECQEVLNDPVVIEHYLGKD
ncbi:MAG: lipopolysaccharide export system ATP-binding protein [Thermotogota bacterium]|nr:lipopolysaccharide export system ATP-binding protein [Thermotogota bacterium]MDK2864571.1 lipopolysaccharide export system ATP-binding protein [Thermotogota bacterium]HCZ07045.1 LPS export ABC transporter ATP-binding protein [Thermotogota bacterium]